jgi:hypothetical protein
MKGTLRALVLVLVIGTLMVPAVGMTIDEQTDEYNQTDTTTEDLQPIFEPATTAIGALIMLVAGGILFSWLGVFD